jgi:hypothetical protein
VISKLILIISLQIDFSYNTSLYSFEHNAIVNKFFGKIFLELVLGK